VMVLPLVVLAILSVIGGWVGTPGNNRFGNFLAPVFSQYSEGLPAATVSGVATGEHAAAAEHESAGGQPASAHEDAEKLELPLTIAASSAGILGFILAWFLYHKRPDLPPKMAKSLQGVYNTISNKYYVDEFYGAAIIRPIVDGSTHFLWRTIDAGLIDGTVNETAHAAGDVSNAFRRMQSGNIRSYAGWVALGAAVVIAFMVWTGTR
jgi:NADH-quinone oxidoreductase subunit L